MSRIETDNVSAGTIFPYKEPVSEDEFLEWVTDIGYTVTDNSRRGVSVGPEGIFVSSSAVAKDDSLEVLVNSDASLRGFSTSSFITFKDTSGDEFDRVVGDCLKFWNEYSEFDVNNDAACVELILEGRLVIQRGENDFSNYFNSSSLNALSKLSESTPKGVAKVIEPDTRNLQQDWYRLFIDTIQVDNPRRWGFKFQKRYRSPKTIDENEIIEVLEEHVNNSGNNSDG